jgi:type IV secretory pathway protease TraF
MPPRGRRRAALACWALGGLAALHFAGPAHGLPPLLLANTSPSMPVGLYRLAHRPPVRVGEVAVLPRPPHHRAPWLMKRVMGTAGSLYCWDAALGTHRLDGWPMPPPSRLALELGVPVWRGCRRLEHGELVGYGEGASYDSRHLGPVQESQLWGAYELLVAYAAR